MGDFKRYNKTRFGGRDRKFGGRDSGRMSKNSKLEMHEVTCDKCGKKCEVPFKPTSSKPVYCIDCFRKKSSSESGGRYDQSEGLEQINIKLDKILKALKIN